MQKKIIVGIHGLANKPPKAALTNWWLRAINEGLEWIHADVLVPSEQFNCVYWADAMYIKPRTVEEPDDSPFKLNEPYTQSTTTPPFYQSTVSNRVDIAFAKKVNDFFYNHNFTGFLNKLARPIVATTMKELDIYGDPTRRFHGNQTASEFLTEQLYKMLKEYQDASVMLIAHSMGSLIAYETLKHHSDVSVDQLITIGSPLMLLGFKKGLLESQQGFPGCSWPVVTQNIHAWKNFVDWQDPIVMKALVTLREYYLTPEGQPVVEDALVDNNYTYQNKKGESVEDHHKSYGYLRCPEVSAAIRDFLQVK